jgi:hypothetical protein
LLLSFSTDGNFKISFGDGISGDIGGVVNDSSLSDVVLSCMRVLDFTALSTAVGGSPLLHAIEQ